MSLYLITNYLLWKIVPFCVLHQSSYLTKSCRKMAMKKDRHKLQLRTLHMKMCIWAEGQTFRGLFKKDLRKSLLFLYLSIYSKSPIFRASHWRGKKLGFKIAITYVIHGRNLHFLTHWCISGEYLQHSLFNCNRSSRPPQKIMASSMAFESLRPPPPSAWRLPKRPANRCWGNAGRLAQTLPLINSKGDSVLSAKPPMVNKAVLDEAGKKVGNGRKGQK